jgi:DNA invertase Pin-like site-specific DNA recombinase
MPIPVAQYVRKSTDLQEYSIENQKVTIQHYAQGHGFEIVKTYVDAGRSGVILKLRGGLNQLLKDVLNGGNEYKAILVYDVSRWGRFQDADESAHYEFLCKNAGIPVHYCAELFPNDGTLPSSIFKALKRTMAAEYSRELSVKVSGAQKRLAQLGYRMGGAPGYGLRRLLVRADKLHTQKLRDGQRKSLAMDHVILVPGPKKEVECVKMIYASLLRGMTMSDIARALNQHRMPFLGGRKWTSAAVGRTLRNPKYKGTLTYNRTTCKLHTRVVNTPTEQWTVKPRAYAPLIDERTFEKVQVLLKKRAMRKTREELLDVLRKLWKREGKLSQNLIDHDAHGLSVSGCHRRLGPLREVYKELGYEPPAGTFLKMDGKKITLRLRAEVLAQIAELFPKRVSFFYLPRGHRHLIKLDNSLCVSVLMCRSQQTLWRGLRWVIAPTSYESDYVTLLCRLNKENNEIHSLYLFPRLDKRHHSVIPENDLWWNRGQRIELWQFYSAVNALYRMREAA